MAYPQRGTTAERHGQRVLTDDPDRGELHLNAALPIVTVAEQEVFVCNIVPHNPYFTRQLRKDPNPLTATQRTGGVINRGAGTDDPIEPCKGVSILQRLVVISYQTEHGSLAVRHSVDTNCCKFVGN